MNGILYEPECKYSLLRVVVYRWFLDLDPNYTNNNLSIMQHIEEILDNILSLLVTMRVEPSLLRIVIFYTDKFLRGATIMYDQLFSVLLISTIVTMKFWTENLHIKNYMFAQIFNRYKLKDINMMEICFLNAIGYDLAVTEKNISQYLKSFIDNKLWPTLSAYNHNIKINSPVTTPTVSSPTSSILKLTILTEIYYNCSSITYIIKRLINMSGVRPNNNNNLSGGEEDEIWENVYDKLTDLQTLLYRCTRNQATANPQEIIQKLVLIARYVQDEYDLPNQIPDYPQNPFANTS
ncbi:hypothetical protein PPL_04771 [Heterostelium album PN500]|uniref:Uncharacterized protein n=1 Tax=Heterostelium pallidum (strain ATCC 26659 / Pp 5 / PN500) TaxID=670386 RepID=D3B8H8_HETP5|nr:hypothetical protein PPL_04771 [Heterostelium album PN500]EFA82346.1 hypothetical protein PPL_04771 [Heterostelium album PN500]|eukprot:XP_020434463.1 hypothetical protein PPL_04771 [Heterostelium album PN500]